MPLLLMFHGVEDFDLVDPIADVSTFCQISFKDNDGGKAIIMLKKEAFLAFKDALNNFTPWKGEAQ